ncbi:MAG: hypothetical protein MNPFHGCM_02482 [Gemmatimonadaceae bacterium]|nr:hypothetical protein [Gemmatimonadaceae bacterium]
MAHLLSDAHMAWRSIVARPGFSIALILTIAFGVGINTATFSAVDAILLRPLSFPNSDRLVSVWGFKPQIGRETASVPDFNDWKAQASSFEKLTAYTAGRETLGRAGGDPERLTSARVMPDFFATMGVSVPLGRDFGPDDFVFGTHRNIILSDGLWRDRFGSDARVIGTTVMLNGAPYTVVGVARHDASAPPGARLWTPLAFDPAQGQPSRRNDFLTVIGRLRPDATIASAQRDLSAIAKRLEADFPRTNTGWTTLVESLQETLVGSARRALLVFMAVVAIVLAVTCANVANLLLARAVTREREMVVRSMLGADRARLFAQLVMESMAIAIVGGLLGLGISVWGVELIRQFAPAETPRLAEVGVNARAARFAIAVSLSTGLLFGLAPALRLSRVTVGASSRGVAGGRPATRARSLLVATQVAMACVLLVGGGLLVRSFRQMQRVSTGFDGDGVLTFALPLPREKYRDLAHADQFFSQVAERFRSMPGVQSVGLTSDLPLAGGGNFSSFDVHGRPPIPNDVVQDATPIVVDPDHFRTMGIVVREGRGIEGADLATAPGVAVVNQAFVRKYFAQEPAIGRQITFDGTNYRTIVGVTADVRLESLTADVYPAVYLAFAQQPQRTMSVALRANGNPLLILPAARDEIKAIDPDVPIVDAATMAQRLSGALSAPRTASSLAGAFAILATGLAFAGLYGLIAYAVSQRTRELGVRMALGATRRQVISLVLRQGMPPAVVGVLAGLVLALTLTRMLGSLLYGVAPHDFGTFAWATAAILGLATLACAIPARRASRLDPVTALRLE